MHTAQYRRTFWSRCTNTLSSYTLLPNSQLVSPYGQRFLDTVAHSERATVKSIIMPTELNPHPRPSAVWNADTQDYQLTILLSKMEQMGSAMLSDCVLLYCEEERQQELSSPLTDSKRILVNLSHIIKLASSWEKCSLKKLKQLIINTFRIQKLEFSWSTE